MGVSGAGKTTVGESLARRLGWPFKEGDDFHPPANVEKMRSGQPLDDTDRDPWLEAIGAFIDEQSASDKDWVLSCSALKRAYREQLRHGRKAVRFVFLEGSQALIARRIESRRHAYMPASLLASQFADLEPPGPDEGALRVDVSQSIDSMVGEIIAGLGLGQ